MNDAAKDVPRRKTLADGWYSKRVHGRVEPCVGTIMNTRDAFPRNRNVKFGGVVQQFHKTAIYRLAMPYTITHPRKLPSE